MFDRPGTQRFAEETMGRFGLSDRIEFAPGDYLSSPLPGHFDVIWLAHILHAENPTNCRGIVNKAADALETGGLMIVHDFLLDEAMDGPLFPALFALNMLLGTDGGQAYPQLQVETMLKDAGLRAIERRPLDSPNDSGLLIGYK